MDDSIGKQYMSTVSSNHGNNITSYVASSTIGITNNNNNLKLKNEINYKHLINFNQLAEKLKKLQKTNQSCGASPSVRGKKSFHETSASSTQVHDSTRKSQQLIYPRSISTFDNNRNLIKQKVNKKYSYNSIDRQVQYSSSSRNLESEHINTTSYYGTQLHHQHQQQNHNQIPFQSQQQLIEPTTKTNNKKHKSELSFNSSVSSSSLSSFESESFEMSCSNTSSRCSSTNSFYCDTNTKKSNNHSKSVISCTNNTSSTTNNNLKSKHGKSINSVDAVNLAGAGSTAKQIVIRREKSIGYKQQQPVQTPLNFTNTNKTIQISSSSFNTLYYNSTNMSNPNDGLTSTPKVNRSKPIKNSKSSSSSSNNELKQNKMVNTSSTTSGIESNSKNSNYDNDCVVLNTKQETKSDLIDTNTDSISSACEINELKNKLFIIESDLNNERKKLNQEKDAKRFLQYELKSRYEAEKTTALKSLEAKLNAEKAYEINKLKESYEQQRREEFDTKQKLLENQIINLKMKLREKSEKCSNMEKLLKEEQNKNDQLFSKSIEMVHKYNQEIKTKKETNQQLNDSSIEIIKKRLVQILMQISNQNFTLNKPDYTDLNQLLSQLESLSKYLTKSLSDTKLEASTLREQIEKLNNEYTSCKEQKLKLEALYKVKCKSDLNKSAQIKKCQLNFDIELMKFRNEFNYDVVRHLESQICIKDAELIDLNLKLDNLNQLVLSYSSCESSSLNSKDIIKSLNNIINSTTTTTNDAFKKVPLNIVYTKKRTESSPIKNENYNNNTNSSSNSTTSSCNERNKQLQEEMIKLDRQLNEMKSLKIKLAKEKQDLLELNKESHLKPKLNANFRSMDSTFTTTSNSTTNQHET